MPRSHQMNQANGRSVMNVFLIRRQTSAAAWLAGFCLKIFRLIKLQASSFQLTFTPRSNLLHYLKGHCFHWKHSMTNMMIQYSHAGICRALFSISFLSERWISLSFTLTFCCWLGVSRRKLWILFRALILMNVSIEQYSDVSCFRKREARVLLIAQVHAYWEGTKLNSWQSSSVGSRRVRWRHVEPYMTLSSSFKRLCAEYWTLDVILQLHNLCFEHCFIWGHAIKALWQGWLNFI